MITLQKLEERWRLSGYPRIIFLDPEEFWDLIRRLDNKSLAFFYGGGYEEYSYLQFLDCRIRPNYLGRIEQPLVIMKGEMDSD